MSESLLWERLNAELQHRVSLFRGVAGLAVCELAGEYRVSINADEIFPAASTIKIPILVQLFRKVEAGELDLDRCMAIDKSVRVGGSGVLAYLDDVGAVSVRNLATLMIIVSDNTATNLCIDLATYEGTNTMLRELGFEKTTLRRKMQDHSAAQCGDENVTTPGELATFLGVLNRRATLSSYVCDETLRVLRKPKKGYLLPGLPDDVVLANKPGGMDRVRNDAGIVFLPRRPYIISVMTKYGSSDHAEQEQFIADVARTTHEYMTRLDATNRYGQGVPISIFSRIAPHPEG